MMSRSALDPELEAGLAAFPPFADLSAATLAELRNMTRELARAQRETTPQDGVVCFEKFIAGPPGAPDVRTVVYRPATMEGPLPVYLHIHGGGLVMGIPEMRHAASIASARSFPCIVVSVDYRLAPEAPYPAALEDCYAVLRGIHAQAAELNADTSRLVVGGESAGGGLAAALAIITRDRGEFAIRHQMLTYPMLDDRTGHSYGHPYVGEYVWTRANNEFAWQAYLGAEADASVPYAVPARAADLEGLPPAFLATGTLDLFFEEDVEYARRLVRAGVSTELHVYPGAFHAFDLIATAQVSAALRRDWRDALARAFGREGSK